MKKTLLTLIACLVASLSFAGNLLTESFEYGNHDMTKPIGWNCDDDSWLCGYLEKDHNRAPHTGNWYAFSNAEDSWMFMPMYFIESIRYRFTLWAVSDGEFQFEIWAGSAPSTDAMHTLFHSTTFNKDEYEKLTIDVETIPPDCQYFAIHALALNGATYFTIDDVEVDMVEQYNFTAEPITGDTALYPGTEAVFHYLVHNIGYDAVDVTMHPSNEFFTNFSCFVNGENGMTFPTQPGETIEVTTYATLRPEVQPGTVAWLDIMMTIPCNCNTAMVTFWVTPLDPDGLQEASEAELSVFPNPVADFVNVEADELQHVTLYDLNGRMIKSVPACGNALRIEMQDLPSGTYFISAKTRTTSSLVKSILKM